MALAVTVGLFSCELSSGFLSDSERSTLYTLKINASDSPGLVDGAVVLPGTEISAIVAKKSGALDLASLEFSLASQDGKTTTGLRLLASAAQAAPGGSSKSVAAIDGKLSGFAIPESAASGLYVLTVSVSGPDGSILQKESLHLFVGRSQPAIDSVSIFPPSVEPGSSVLLGLTVSWQSLAAGSSSTAVAPPASTPTKAAAKASASIPAAPAETRDPWIRWSRDGSTFAEGLFSKGLDKVVWAAPRNEGAYSLLAEVFPSAPPAGGSFPFTAPVSQGLKVMVIAPAGGSGNDFADPLAFYSLLRFDGSFDDVGTRPRTAQPEAFGSPVLDTYSSGFGYRFGPSSGVRIPGLMPPGSAGKLGAFSTLLRLDSDRTDGTLVRYASDDGSWALVIGIQDSRPYVESLESGKAQRSTAPSSLPRFPLTIEAILKPEGDKLAIAWRIEGEPVEGPSLALPAAPPTGGATIGGDQSLPGVYDGFGLIAGGASPSYRLASRRKWKASLVIAESFEDGVLPPLSTAKGGVSVSDGSLALEPGGSLALGPSFGIGSSLLVEAEIEGDRSSCALALYSSEGARILAVGGLGDVTDPSGASVGSIPAAGGKTAFSLELKDGSIYLRGAGTDALALPCKAGRFVLSLERASAGSGTAAFDRVLIRVSSVASIPK